jgi:putative DNA methylase
MTPTKKKLIEVALPLEAINAASAREKSIRHGHPSTLHLWWARRPLAAARAVIFAQMVDDPVRETERQKLFRLIEQLVSWENTTNETVLAQARDEIWKSWRATCADNKNHPGAKELFDPERLPTLHDPFAGGGTLPLEAQRLGLESYASELNPVAVLINKAMIEIPPKFADFPPVNPEARKGKGLIGGEWHRAQGLAEDVRYYGQRMRAEAEKRIGHLYPKIEVTPDMVKERLDLKPYLGAKLTVIAWLWARTVKSPNPAFAQLDVPLASTFMLSTKAGKEAYVEPVIEDGGYRFTVKVGKPKEAEAAKNGTKLTRGANFRCLMSTTPIAPEYIKAEGMAGRMSARLMAVVAEGPGGRVYLSPTKDMEKIAAQAAPTWKPDQQLPYEPRAIWCTLYGLTTYDRLFTPRQLVALTTFSDLVLETRRRIERDASTAGLLDDGRGFDAGGTGATAYADAVAVYLAFCVDKMTDTNTCLCSWQIDPPRLRATFGRQALPMVWDYAEANIFGDAAGDFGRCVRSLTEVLDRQGLRGIGLAYQKDAMTPIVGKHRVFSTDPPYYDNIGYADLSDFFYVWLRRAVKPIFPDLFATLAVPKVEELVASPYRHGSKDKAEAFFLEGMTQAMHRLAERAHPAFPVTIYYAFKQFESDAEDGTASTGWDTFLDAVIRAGFAITGTWPLRSELATRNVGRGTNALASSIVLVCRLRSTDAPTATRREFVTALKAELPEALRHLQRSNIAPVDLAQAAIGPGMAVYTRYAKVVDAEGKRLSVREALALINQTLDEALAEQEGDFDSDSRWALAWFEQSGFDQGEYGVAETLSKAKNTSVARMVAAGILTSKGGKVRLLKPSELPSRWDPATDLRLTAWESVHHLVRVLEAGGESAAAELVAKIGSKAEIARELAYRLYTVCERKKRTQDALSYNSLVQSWPEITRLAREGSKPKQSQAQLFDQE